MRWFDDVCNVGRPFVARPGPAAAHGHRSLALQSLRRPPHRWRLVCWRVVWCVVSTPGRVPRLDVFPLLSFACNSPATLSNREFTTLELQRFQTLLKLHPIELHAKFGGGGVVAAQGVAARPYRPRVSQPGAVGQVDRWSETPVAFARLYPCGIETAIAFAGEKWVFLVQFSGAEVMPVSAVPCWG